MVVGTDMVIVERNGYRFKVPQKELDDYLKRYDGAKVVEGEKQESKTPARKTRKTDSDEPKDKAES